MGNKQNEIRILIVEDDQILANIYRSRLENDGFLVAIAKDGQQGYDLTLEWKPSLILLDLMLPKISGIRMLRMIRNQPEFEKTPVLVFTNAYVPNIIEQAQSHGAYRIYNKSAMAPKQLLDEIYRIFSLPVKATASKALSPEMTQAELRRFFHLSIPEKLKQLQALRASLAGDPDSAMNLYPDLFDLVRKINKSAAQAELPNVTQFCSALEALLQLCWEQPKGVTASTQVTLLQALDLLEHLAKVDTGTNLLDNPPVCILVMACDPLANQAIVHALGKGLLAYEAIEEPILAAQALNHKRYDLILLDVAVPQIDGLEFASHIQRTVHNEKTAVLYLTNIRDFENRVSAKTSNGQDLIVLPFSFIELTVKILCLIFRSKSSSPTGK